MGIFFTGLGIRILQGYGQTGESGPVISVNPPTGYRIDSVGLPFSEAEVKLQMMAKSSLKEIWLCKVIGARSRNF